MFRLIEFRQRGVVNGDQVVFPYKEVELLGDKFTLSGLQTNSVEDDEQKLIILLHFGTLMLMGSILDG
jgi:hypothetical protein